MWKGEGGGRKGEDSEERIEQLHPDLFVRRDNDDDDDLDTLSYIQGYTCKLI